MSLIQDIQAAAISPSNDVSRLLLMCKLLVARLGHSAFAEWVECELNGYLDDADLPSYRLTPVENYGYYVRCEGRLHIPVSVFPDSDVRDDYRVARMGGPISSYQRLADGEPDATLRLPWAAEVARHYGSKATNGLQCIEAWKEIPVGAIDLLLHAIKARVLGFAIDIERVKPDAGESPVGKRPISESKMTQIFHTNITGNVGNVANGGTNFSQSAQMAVGTGDWEGLRQQLLSLGLKDADLSGLKADLDEAKAQGTGLEGKQRSWTGKLLGKAIEGAAGVSVEALAGGVAKAIGGYLGLS